MIGRTPSRVLDHVVVACSGKQDPALTLRKEQLNSCKAYCSGGGCGIVDIPVGSATRISMVTHLIPHSYFL